MDTPILDAFVETSERRDSGMDRAFLMALIVFVALAIVGIFLVASPTTFVTAPGDVDALRTIGGALFAAGLAAFLVEAFHSQRERETRNA